MQATRGSERQADRRIRQSRDGERCPQQSESRTPRAEKPTFHSILDANGIGKRTIRETKHANRSAKSTNRIGETRERRKKAANSERKAACRAREVANGLEKQALRRGKAGVSGH